MNQKVRQYLDVRQTRAEAERLFKQDMQSVGHDGRLLLDDAAMQVRKGILEVLRKAENDLLNALGEEVLARGFPSVELKPQGHIASDPKYVRQWAQEQADQRKRAVWFIYEGQRYEAVPTGSEPSFVGLV